MNKWLVLTQQLDKIGGNKGDMRGFIPWSLLRAAYVGLLPPRTRGASQFYIIPRELHANKLGSFGLWIHGPDACNWHNNDTYQYIDPNNGLRLHIWRKYFPYSDVCVGIPDLEPDRRRCTFCWQIACSMNRWHNTCCIARLYSLLWNTAWWIKFVGCPAVRQIWGLQVSRTGV